jgi:hypothetical protein
MTVTCLAEFQQQVLHDVVLQEPLRAITDRTAFVAAVVQLGNAHGYTFTAEEVEAVMRVNQRNWIERWVL